MGGLAVLALSRLLFPAMAMLIMCFFCERIAAVEALDYPGYDPPRYQPIGETRERCCV